MAITNNNIIYFQKNVVRALSNWDILDGASYIGDSITIQPGGTVGSMLNNNYYNGLKSCRYREITAVIEGAFNATNNYIDKVNIVIRGVYTDFMGNNIVCYFNVNSTLLGSRYSNNMLRVTRVLEMENYNLVACGVYVENNSEQVIKLKSFNMLRSQDVSPEQVGESIGWGIGLRKVSAYIDGCEVYYDGEEDPDKMWWLEDEQGEFAGINVNNERMIKFERINEILLD